MPFSIQVEGHRYSFLGPVTLNQLPPNSGVYMVMGSGGIPVYIGESANIWERVNNHHHRERSWKYYGSGNSVRYVLIPNASLRKKVEQAAIDKWNPPSNRT